MRSFQLLLLLLITFVVTIFADDSIPKERDGVVTSTSSTTIASTSTTKSGSVSTTQTSATSTAKSSSVSTTQTSATSTARSSSVSNTQASATSTSATPTSATSTTASSTSPSATSTSSATSTPFRWNAAEVAALVVLLGFIFLGVVAIATWQIRCMLAMRRDKAGLGVYSKHKLNPSVDMDAPDADAGFVMDQRPQPPESYGSLAHTDLEHQPTGYSATMYQYPAIDEPMHSTAIPYTDPLQQARSPSPYSQQARSPNLYSPYSRSPNRYSHPATPPNLYPHQPRSSSPYTNQSKLPNTYSQPTMRPLAENALRRLYSFEDVPSPITPLH